MNIDSEHAWKCSQIVLQVFSHPQVATSGGNPKFIVLRRTKYKIKNVFSGDFWSGGTSIFYKKIQLSRASI